MTQIVSFVIQKGGCGKTTTTVNTAAYLADQGFRVLAVDMDPQGNMTQHFGYDTEQLTATLLQLFQQKKSFQEVLLKRSDTLHILPNNIEMSSVESLFLKAFTREFLLRDVLHPIRHLYDFILIDCPPNLGLLSINALAASTEFVLVVSPEFFPMKAIKPLYDTYQMVRQKLNRTLRFRGVLMTMCDFRTRHSQEIRAILEKNFPSRLYRTYIRMNVALKEAASVGKSIFEYAPSSPGAFDYQNFAEEFVRDHDKVAAKRAYYESRFQALPPEEQKEILEFALKNLSDFVRLRLEEPESIHDPILKNSLIVERNKILERLFPYRHYYQTQAE